MNLLDEGKISGYQLFASLIVIRLTSALLLNPTLNLISNPPTAWVNELIGGTIAMLLVWLIVHLGLKFPDKTIIGYAEELLGPIAGKMLGALLVGYFFMVAVSVIRTLGEANVAVMMPQTPILVFIVSATGLIAYSVRNGLENHARFAGFGMPLMVFTLLLVTASAWNLMDLGYLRPFFFPQGPRELIWPSASVLSFYAHFLIIGMLLPYVNIPAKTMPISIGAIVMTTALLIFQSYVMTSLFGPLLNSLTLPTFTLAQNISIGHFFERFESLVTVLFVVGAGSKTTVFLWATAVGLSQLLNLNDYRPLVYPLGALLVSVSIFAYKSLIDLVNVLSGSMIVFSVSLLLLILLVLFIALGTRKSVGGGDSNAGQD